MSNNKPMCDDTLANKGVAEPRALWNEHINATPEQVFRIVQYLSDEFNQDFNDEFFDLMKKPDDVGLMYTTFDEFDENDELVAGHEYQISLDLISMTFKVYTDNVFVHHEPFGDDDLRDFDFDSLYNRFLDIAYDLIPTDEQIANEQNPYMDEHRKLVEAVKKSNERLEVTRPLKEAIMNRFNIDDVTAWRYANNAYDDGQGLDDLVSILHEIQDDLRPERNY